MHINEWGVAACLVVKVTFPEKNVMVVADMRVHFYSRTLHQLQLGYYVSYRKELVV